MNVSVVVASVHCCGKEEHGQWQTDKNIWDSQDKIDTTFSSMIMTQRRNSDYSRKNVLVLIPARVALFLMCFSVDTDRAGRGKW